MRFLRYFEYLMITAALTIPTTAKAEIINWRDNCNSWDHVTAEETY